MKLINVKTEDVKKDDGLTYMRIIVDDKPKIDMSYQIIEELCKVHSINCSMICLDYIIDYEVSHLNMILKDDVMFLELESNYFEVLDEDNI